ncbi:MAG: sulfatase-like hydrolase/transferase [Chitinophagales bacterium]|nr:sulfatase-like hydrolase/transferase [Chitinophagales bacterium]
MKKLVILSISLSLLSLRCDKDFVSAIVDQLPEPNIILIIADDVGLDATPGYPFSGVIKPNMSNLESLALNGITFDNVWANPVCSPTRATILTGKYGYSTGVLNAGTDAIISSSELTIQKYLDDNVSAGYSHAVIGKWHLSNDVNQPTQMGIGYYAGIISGAVSSYDIWPFTDNGQTTIDSTYVTTKLTNLAIDWINQQSSPWFCWLAYNAPHTPFHLPPDSMHSQGVLPTDAASINSNPLPYYMAMLESIDFEIGRLLNNIPADERDRTIIIFIGDNGTPSDVVQAPYSAQRSKASLFQGGINVPMVASGYGVSRINERDSSLISSTDLFATIAELGGKELPVYEDSYSFKALLSNKEKGPRVYNYSEVKSNNLNRSGYTIRNEKYKLLDFENGNKLFYDLENDPFESNNLLNGTLTAEQDSARIELLQEANDIRQ